MIHSKEEIRWWYNEKYYNGSDSKRPYGAYPVFLGYLRCGKAGALLDVACGRGSLLLAASKIGLSTFGIDISEEAVKIARTASPSSVITCGSGEDIRYGDKVFDYVTCLGSLEHFSDINKGLSEMKRVAKDNATFCIMVPNSQFVVWKISGKSGTEQQDINEKLLSLRQWKDIFLSNGFRIIRLYKDKWYLKFSTDNFMGFIKRFLGRIAWFLIPARYNYQFVFILKK